jgi:hypothetical protein
MKSTRRRCPSLDPLEGRNLLSSLSPSPSPAASSSALILPFIEQDHLVEAQVNAPSSTCTPSRGGGPHLKIFDGSSG